MDKLNFTGGIGKLLHWIGYFLVFGFTASCTYLLFQSITPPTLWWLPVLALGFIEYGALKWKAYHKQVAEGVMQHVTSLFLLLVCIVAIVGTTTLEVTKWFAGDGYLVAVPWVVTLTVYYLVATIGLNVLAYMTIDLIHPDHVAKLQALGPSRPAIQRTHVVEADPVAIGQSQQHQALPAPHQTEIDYDKLAEAMHRRTSVQEASPSSPLQEPRMETKQQASHEGNQQNGKSQK